MYPFNKDHSYWIHPVLARRRILSDGDLIESIRVLDKEASFYLMVFDTFGYQYNSLPNQPDLQQLSSEKERLHMKLRKAMCRQHYTDSIRRPLWGNTPTPWTPYQAGELYTTTPTHSLFGTIPSAPVCDPFINSAYHGEKPEPMEIDRLKQVRHKLIKSIHAARQWMGHYCVIPGDVNGSKVKLLYKSMGVRILEEV